MKRLYDRIEGYPPLRRYKVSDNELLVGAIVLAARVPEVGTLEEKLTATMKAAPEEIWFSVDDDMLFRCAVGAVMEHYGKDTPEWGRISHELKGLRLLSTGMAISALARHMEDGPKPVGLLKLWRSIKEAQGER